MIPHNEYRHHESSPFHQYPRSYKKQKSSTSTKPFSNSTFAMSSPTKKTRTQKPTVPRLKINMPKQDPITEVTERSSKPRLKINLPKAPQAEKPTLPEQHAATSDSDSAKSNQASPVSDRTTSPNGSVHGKEHHEKDEVFDAACIIFRMAHSKPRRAAGDEGLMLLAECALLSGFP